MLSEAEKVVIGVVCGLIGLILIFLIYNNFNYPKSTSNNKSLNVLIIGGSKGIGLDYAKHFLSYNDNVTITSRKQNAIDNAINVLNNHKNLTGIVCDITSEQSLSDLFNGYNDKNIDIIINNAGYVGRKNDYLWNYASNDIETIVKTNLYGTLLSCKLAINNYINNNKEHKLHIFNVNGGGDAGLLVYQTSKAGVPDILKLLNKELEQSNLNDKISVHMLFPGMVWTTMLSNAMTTAKHKLPSNIINILVSTSDEITAYFVPLMRGVVFKNANKYYDINYYGKYPPLTLFAKFIAYFCCCKNKNKFLDSNYNVVTKPT